VNIEQWISQIVGVGRLFQTVGPDAEKELSPWADVLTTRTDN